MTEFGRKPLALVLGILVIAHASGCGGWGGRGLTLGYLGWDENVANSNLIKVLLEDEFGYETVELELADDVRPVFEGVASGELDAFTDVWIPNHEQLLAEVEDDVEHLPTWYQGQTTFGLAVPSYMTDTKSIADLNQSGVAEIIGIEPGAPFMEKVEKDVIPEYDLDLDLVEASTPAMLSEVGRLYEEKEPFAFMPWCPHWMCVEFDFQYLEDPKNAQSEFDEPAKISSIVDENLSEDDPVAYAFLKAIKLNADQLNSLENEIRKADDPIKGSQAWLENNRDVVQPWIEAAKRAQ